MNCMFRAPYTAAKNYRGTSYLNAIWVDNGTWEKGQKAVMMSGTTHIWTALTSEEETESQVERKVLHGAS